MPIANAKTQNQKILVEQVRILYRTLLPILAVNLVVSSALLSGLWNIVSQTTLTIWMILMVIVLVIRVGTYFIYRRNFVAEVAQRYVYIL